MSIAHEPTAGKFDLDRLDLEPGPAGWPAWTDLDRWEPTEADRQWHAAEAAVAVAIDPDDTDDPLDRLRAELRAIAAEADDGEPAEPALSFDAWIAVQAGWYRALGSEAGDWLAAKIDDLAHECAFHGATSPGDFDDRRAQQERWLDDRGRDFA